MKNLRRSWLVQHADNRLIREEPFLDRGRVTVYTNGPLEVFDDSNRGKVRAIYFSRNGSRYIASWQNYEGKPEIALERIPNASNQRAENLDAEGAAFALKIIEAELMPEQRGKLTAGLEALKAEAVKRGADKSTNWPYKAEPASTSPAP